MDKLLDTMTKKFSVFLDEGKWSDEEIFEDDDNDDEECASEEVCNIAHSLTMLEMLDYNMWKKGKSQTEKLQYLKENYGSNLSNY